MRFILDNVLPWTALREVYNPPNVLDPHDRESFVQEHRAVQVGLREILSAMSFQCEGDARSDEGEVSYVMDRMINPSRTISLEVLNPSMLQKAWVEKAAYYLRTLPYSYQIEVTSDCSHVDPDFNEGNLCLVIRPDAVIGSFEQECVARAFGFSTERFVPYYNDALDDVDLANADAVLDALRKKNRRQ